MYRSCRGELAVVYSGLYQLFDIKPGSLGGSRYVMNSKWFYTQTDLIPSAPGSVAGRTGCLLVLSEYKILQELFRTLPPTSCNPILGRAQKAKYQHRVTYKDTEDTKGDKGIFDLWRSVSIWG